MFLLLFFYFSSATLNVQPLVHSGEWCWEKTAGSVLLPLTERGAGCGISHLLCLQSGKVLHLPILLERGWLCWFALMMVARLDKSETESFVSVLIITPTGDWDEGHLSCVVTWCLGAAFSPTSAMAGCYLCCCSYLSHVMTYPSRVCSANSF